MKRVVGSRHFRSALLAIFGVCGVIYLIAVCVLTFQLISGMKRDAQEKAGSIGAAVQEVFSSAKANAVLIGSVKSVEGLLALPSPTLDDYMAMASDLSVCANITWYESVDVIMRNPRKVYVSQVGMYTYDDYPGQDLIALAEGERPPGERWLTDREYRLYYGEQYPRRVATYLRRVPVYTSGDNGYVAVHVSLGAVGKLIRENSLGSGYSVLVSHGDVPIYAPSGFSAGEEPFADVALRYAQDGGYLYAASSGGADVQCACLIPRDMVARALASHVPAAALALVLMALAVTLCAYLYSSVMLRPVDALVRKAGESGGAGDEFELLNRAFDRLSGEIDGVRRQMERNRPIIQERLVLELVSSYTEIPPDYADHGVEFPHRHFAVVVTAFPEPDSPKERSLREPIKLFVREKAMEQFAPLGKVYCAYGEGEMLVFLINTDWTRDLEAGIRRICEPLAREFRETLSMPLVFSVGVCPRGERAPYRAYVQAKRGLSYAGDIGGSAVYLSGPADYAPTVDFKTVRQMARCVLDHDLPRLRVQLGAYFQKYLPDGAGIEDARKLSTMLLCHIHAHMLELDAPVDGTRLAAAIKKLGAAQTPDDCAAILQTWLSSLMDARVRLPEESYAYVRDSIAFIEAHYAENLSIPQIAQQVSINPVYLNKLFKLSTGKTISEYLNSHRIETSKKLLTSGDATVASISSQIGYHDVRSFIRFFKKFTGVTPGDYRQQNMP